MLGEGRIVTMARRRHTPEQIVRKLREADRLLNEGKDLAEVARHLEVSEATYHRWRAQYGGMKADDAKRLRELERENGRLKRIVADKELEIDARRGAFKMVLPLPLPHQVLLWLLIVTWPVMILFGVGAHWQLRRFRKHGVRPLVAALQRRATGMPSGSSGGGRRGTWQPTVRVTGVGWWRGEVARARPERYRRELPTPALRPTRCSTRPGKPATGRSGTEQLRFRGRELLRRQRARVVKCGYLLDPARPNRSRGRPVIGRLVLHW
jgi:putative transposase